MKGDGKEEDNDGKKMRRKKRREERRVETKRTQDNGKERGE